MDQPTTNDLPAVPAPRNVMPAASGSRVDHYLWLFMRISGLVLIFMALAHFVYLRIYLPVDAIDFDLVVARLHKPFWRVYDWVLLALAVTHGMNGVRLVLNDHAPKRLRRALLWVLCLIYTVLILAGTSVIIAQR